MKTIIKTLLTIILTPFAMVGGAMFGVIIFPFSLCATIIDTIWAEGDKNE